MFLIDLYILNRSHTGVHGKVFIVITTLPAISPRVLPERYRAFASTAHCQVCAIATLRLRDGR